MVEEGLLPSTLERKYMAFLLVQRAIPLLSPEQLPFALSPPLLRTLVHSIDGERDGTNFVLKPAAAATVSLTLTLTLTLTPTLTLTLTLAPHA